MNNKFLADIQNAVSQAVHQCNNHLSIILSNCELALTFDDLQITRKKVENCISRISKLTELLSQLNRLTSVATEIKPTVLKSMFETSLKKVEARANARQIRCTSRISADGIYRVPVQIIDLIIDLLGTNAICAAETGNEKIIEFEIVQHSNELSIVAANSGVPPASTSDKNLYNSFFSNQSEPVYDSLASVKSLAEFLGGQIFYKKNSSMNEIHIKLPLKN